MHYAISLDERETRATPNERLEALKARYPQLQMTNRISNMVISTKEGGVDKFIDALEKVFELRKLGLPLIIDQVTPSRNSLLHLTASFGNLDVMELILLHFPYTVTLKNSLKDTPLHVAVQDQRFNAIEMLIRLGTYSEIIYWKNEDGKSPFYLAVEKCNPSHLKDRKGVEWEIFQLLLQEYARDEAYAVQIQGMSPILAAIKTRKTDILKEIIDRLPRLLHLRDEDGRTPMHAAASDGNEDAIGLLLEECPYLALETDNNGSYPIHIACEAGHIGVISKLLKDTWPDLAEIENKKRQDILHVAAKGGKDRAVDGVLEKYSEPDTIEKLVNAKDVDGNTPLHLASMHNHCEVMRSLTKVKRIDLELWNNDGLTALDVAMESRSLSTKFPALLVRAILIVAGARRTADRDPREQPSGASKSSPTEWIKEQVNTLLLVATLVASVTFTAGITLPGGYNASSDPHPGAATMLYHGAFRVFVIANMFAMYNSILVVVVLLWSPSKDFYVAELAYHLAGPLLSMAVTGISVAFLAAVTAVVSRLTWMGSLVLSMGVPFLVMVMLVLVTLVFPFSKSAMRIVYLYYLVLSVVARFIILFRLFPKLLRI
ncbi:hypothetical protein ACJRO7_006782 [Eucalyptus globulus]|uniref:PGG domain-containing protein n=1 Tax=Eucalyptus globulus TaxID=34317 RepID=A0ABD3IKH0_EUCGL